MLSLRAGKGHEVVGKLVTLCEGRGCRLADLLLSELQQASDKIDETVFDVLGAENAAAALTSFGSGGPDRVREQLALWKKRLG